MAEAADEAKVSRATAYRYFPTQEAMLVEVTWLAPAVAPIEVMLADLRTELGDIDFRRRGLTGGRGRSK